MTEIIKRYLPNQTTITSNRCHVTLAVQEFAVVQGKELPFSDAVYQNFNLSAKDIETGEYVGNPKFVEQVTEFTGSEQVAIALKNLMEAV